MKKIQAGIISSVEKYQCPIDPDDPEPKYRQLANGIKKLIKQGIIGGEEYLPGERSLARHLEVTRDVVHRAYKILEGEGYFKFKNHIGHCLIEKPNEIVRNKSL